MKNKHCTRKAALVALSFAAAAALPSATADTVPGNEGVDMGQIADGIIYNMLTIPVNSVDGFTWTTPGAGYAQFVAPVSQFTGINNDGSDVPVGDLIPLRSYSYERYNPATGGFEPLIYGANNGLTKNADTIQLGGPLIQPTTITQGDNNLVLGQSGTGKFGIGTATPGNKVEIKSGTAGESGLRFTDLTSASTGTQTAVKTLGVDANGDVVVANSAVRPYFKATSPPVSNAANPSGPVNNYTESADDTNAFNPATGKFTPTEAGYYMFNYRILSTPGGTGLIVQAVQIKPADGSPAYTVGRDQRYLQAIPGGTGVAGQTMIASSAFVKLQAGDEVTLWGGMQTNPGPGSGPDTVTFEFSGIKL